MPNQCNMIALLIGGDQITMPDCILSSEYILHKCVSFLITRNYFKRHGFFIECVEIREP